MSRCASHRFTSLLQQPISPLRQQFSAARRCSAAETRRPFSSLGPHIAKTGWYENTSYIAAFAVTCLLGASIASTFSLREIDELGTWKVIAPADEYLNPDMPLTQAGGRLGTLTLDEKIKLQEAWRRLSKICGVPLDDEEEDAKDDTEVTDTQNDGAAAGKEAKKSRRGMFRRKKTDTVNTSEQEEDDKYGQTKEFQVALKENTPEDIRETVWSMVKMDHPDALILRFLRARKWDVDKALIMMISTMNWRKRDMHIEDTIVRQGESVALKEKMSKDDEGFYEQYKMGKSFVHGVDKDGRPICIIRVRLHVPSQQTMKALEDYTVHTIETTRMTLRDPVDTATLIFDMTDFGLKNMDNAPIRFMIKCFEANYPESLGVVAVHKAPWVFQGIWKLIRGWLDPVVAAKINFTNAVEDLEAFIPRKNILKEFGGDDEWEYKYLEPTKEENARLQDTETRDRLLKERQEIVHKFEEKTKVWLRYAPTEPEHDKLTKERDEIAEQLRVDYWKIDPYVRARSLYDRSGVINEGGKIVFYPYRSNPADRAEGEAGLGHGEHSG